MTFLRTFGRVPQRLCATSAFGTEGWLPGTGRQENCGVKRGSHGATVFGETSRLQCAICRNSTGILLSGILSGILLSGILQLNGVAIFHNPSAGDSPSRHFGRVMALCDGARLVSAHSSCGLRGNASTVQVTGGKRSSISCHGLCGGDIISQVGDSSVTSERHFPPGRGILRAGRMLTC
jgi:hypothetical protein